MNNLLVRINNKTDVVKKKIYTSYCIDYSSKYKNSIFLAGTGRSGTTWVSNIINYNNQYRYIFEPFEPQNNEICRHFNPKQYIGTNNNAERLLEPARTILNGNFRSNWSNRFNQKLVTNKRLIKSVRANLFLKWLNVNFPLMPIILLIRHPCAVANSRLQLNWGTSLQKYLIQEDLMQDFLKPFEREIVKAEATYQNHRSIWENSIFTWCIEHYVPLKQFVQGDIHIMFYESLCINPQEELKKLFSYLDKKYERRIFDKFKTASQLSRNNSAVNMGNNLINSWENYVTTEQIQKAKDILSIFGLNRIYAQNSVPSYENLYEFMES